MSSACSITRTRDTLVISTDHTSGGNLNRGPSAPAVAGEDRRQRFALLFAKTLGVEGDLRFQRFAMVGQRNEFHRDRGGRRIGTEPPQRPQRLRRLQHHRLHLEPLFGAASKRRQEQVVHRAEVVVHQLRLERRPFRDPTRSHCGITLFEHQLFGGVEQHRAVLRVRCPDPAGRSHAVIPHSRRISAEPADRSVGPHSRLDHDISVMLSRCSASSAHLPKSVPGDAPSHDLVAPNTTGKTASGGART